MGKAVRAIIIKGDKLLVMHRNKYGSEYYTLVGGRVRQNETLEQALVREVKEETGLDVTSCQLVFTEDHPEPYNQQFIYLCEVSPFDNVGLAPDSEEAILNTTVINIHTLGWAHIPTLASLQFRTPQLHKALIDGFKRGFPRQPVNL